MARSSWLILLLAAGCGRSTRNVSDTPAEAGQGGEPRGGSAGTRVGGGMGGMKQAGRGGGGSGGSAGDDTACSSDPIEIGNLAFDVHLEPIEAGDYVPKDLVFYVDDDSDDLELVIGSPGQAARDTLGRDGSELTLGRVMIRNEVMAQFEQKNELWLEDLRLCVRPQREALPYLSGTGVLHVIQDINDLAYDYSYEVKLGGELDTTPPEWQMNEPVSPLYPAFLALTEPLATSSVTRLVLDDATGTVLEPLSHADVTVAFSYAGVLPFGVALSPVGTARDLAGNELRASSAALVRTPAEPGVLVDGSFETEVPFAMLTSVPGELVPEVIKGPDVIAGSRSLYVPPGAEAVLHLRAPPERRHVRLEARPLVGQLGLPVDIDFRAGVVGSAVTLDYLNVATDVDAGGGAGEGQGGAAGGEGRPSVASLDILLMSPGQDVLLSIRSPKPTYVNQSYVGVVIDDVRIE